MNTHVYKITCFLFEFIGHDGWLAVIKEQIYILVFHKRKNTFFFLPFMSCAKHILCKTISFPTYTFLELNILVNKQNKYMYHINIYMVYKNISYSLD